MRNKDSLTRIAFTLSVAALVIVLIPLWWSGSSSSHTRDGNSQDNHPRGEPKNALIVRSEDREGLVARVARRSADEPARNLQGQVVHCASSGQRTGQSNNLTGVPEANSSSRTSHRLLCADLKTGKHIWDQPIPTDVITAPVISAGRVYFTCFDGTSFCLDSMTGSVVWKKENSGTSAPLVANGDAIMTMKVQERDKPFEGLKRIDPKQGSEKDEKLLAQSEAGYLAENKGGLIGGGSGAGPGLGKAEAIHIDASVGFGNAPPAAKLDSANKQVGVSTVVGGWSYQGSRAAYARGRMMNAQGRFLNCMRAIDGKFAWRAEVKGASVNNDSQVFSPPSLGSQNMYLCSAQGHVLSIRQSDGKVGFLYLFKQPVVFQPALARGNIYLGTANGLLVCLRTNDHDADRLVRVGRKRAA